jgi:hypothetical protein
MAAVSLDYSPWGGGGPQSPGFFNYRANEGAAMNVSGFAWMVPIDRRDSVAVVGGDTLLLAYDTVALKLTVSGGSWGTLEFPLAPTLNALDSSGTAEAMRGLREGLPPEQMLVRSRGGNGAAALQLLWVHGEDGNPGRRVESFSGRLLLGEPRD